MYRGIDTLIGYVLFRPRGPANQTSRSLSSIQTIYTILEPPCSTCPFPYPFLDHIQIWTKTRRNETLSHRVEIVDRFQGGERVALDPFLSRQGKEISFEEISRTGILEEILIASFPSLLVLIFFSIIRSRDVNSGTIIVNVIEYRNARIVFSSYLFSRWSQKFRLKMEGKTNVSQRNRRNR